MAMRSFGRFAITLTLALAGGCNSDPEGGQANGGTGAAGGSAGSAGSATSGSAGTPAGGAGSANGGGAGTGTGGAGAGTSGAGMGGAGGSGGAAAGAGSSAGGAAGSSGAGGAGAGAAGGGAAGSSGDPCATALFCDDFDDDGPGGPPGNSWTLEESGSASIEVSGEHRLSGSQSLRFQVPSGPGGAYATLRNAPIFPVAGNAFYGRMMVWLDAAPETSVHWTFVEGRGLVNGQTYRAAYRLGGQQPVMDAGSFAGNQLMANYETPDSYSGNGPGSDCWFHANRVVIPVARWACVEWHFDGENDAITFWLDGTAVVAVMGTGQGCVNQPASYRWTAPDFSEIRLGWESYQNDSARTLYVDDVAIGGERLSCPSSSGGT